MTKSLSRPLGAAVALALLLFVWMTASAHAATPPGAPNPSVASTSSTASATAGTRPTRATRSKRVARSSARAPTHLPPGAPPAALVGVVPPPWHDVFGEAGEWAAEPIIVGGSTLGGTLANAGVTRHVDSLITGPRAGLTGLYQTVWHRALSGPVQSTQMFVASPEYFGLHF
ncbi:hypothetical protein ACPWR0_05645 [Pandoraea pneumonica]|uniref:hypothetical protein n=1 Tax=Pandoraea pneumonica TaxID=2508299 RepID=UPI003CEED36E